MIRIPVVSWTELSTPPPSSASSGDRHEPSQHMEAVRSRLINVVRRNGGNTSVQNVLKTTPFPLLRALDAANRRSDDFGPVMTEMLRDGHTIAVLYIVAYSYEDETFSHVRDRESRTEKIIQKILTITNRSDLANVLRILMDSESKQEQLRGRVRLSVRMELETSRAPKDSMLELLDEQGYDVVMGVVERHGWIEPTSIRAILEGVPAALSDGAL